jgi:hypothetical protein
MTCEVASVVESHTYFTFAISGVQCECNVQKWKDYA